MDLDEGVADNLEGSPPACGSMVCGLDVTIDYAILPICQEKKQIEGISWKTYKFVRKSLSVSSSRYCPLVEVANSTCLSIKFRVCIATQL
jgi:hypothetical protein